MIFRSLIKSKIDYRCIVYNSASRREIENLEPVSNEAIRICFKLMPIFSLHVLAEEPPLKRRTDKLSLKYYYIHA